MVTEKISCCGECPFEHVDYLDERSTPVYLMMCALLGMRPGAEWVDPPKDGETLPNCPLKEGPVTISLCEVPRRE